MSSTTVTAIVLGGTFALGLCAGAFRPRLAWVPWAATVIAALGYAVLLTLAGAWATQCWECSSGGYEDTRGTIFSIAAVAGAGIAAALLAGTWLAVAISTLTHRLFAAEREAGS